MIICTWNRGISWVFLKISSPRLRYHFFQKLGWFSRLQMLFYSSLWKLNQHMQIESLFYPGSAQLDRLPVTGLSCCVTVRQCIRTYVFMRVCCCCCCACVSSRRKVASCSCACVCIYVCLYVWGRGEGYMQLIINMIIRTVHVWVGVYN